MSGNLRTNERPNLPTNIISISPDGGNKGDDKRTNRMMGVMTTVIMVMVMKEKLQWIDVCFISRNGMSITRITRGVQ